MLSPQHKIVLALLMVAREPLTKSQAEVCLGEELDLDMISNELNHYFATQDLPLLVQPVAEGYRLVTRGEYAPYLARLYQSRGRLKLSKPALETLAIIAYKQPVTKAEIDAIRGVDTNLKPLIDKNLIQIRGRQDGPGRALLYGTSRYFLEYFGLNSIKDLPSLPEIENLTTVSEPVAVASAVNAPE